MEGKSVEKLACRGGNDMNRENKKVFEANSWLHLSYPNPQSLGQHRRAFSRVQLVALSLNDPERCSSSTQVVVFPSQETP
jgi:hypothetical protein